MVCITPEASCVNCKWYRCGAQDEGDWCAHPDNGVEMLPDEVCESWEDKNG